MDSIFKTIIRASEVSLLFEKFKDAEKHYLVLILSACQLSLFLQKALKKNTTLSKVYPSFQTTVDVIELTVEGWTVFCVGAFTTWYHIADWHS